MPVVVLSERELEDDTVQVTLAQDGVRFTVVVAKATAHGEQAMGIYQAMADRQVADQNRLRRIVAQRTEGGD